LGGSFIHQIKFRYIRRDREKQTKEKIKKMEEIKKDENIILEEKTDNIDRFKFFNAKDWKYNIVTYKDAPELYSRRVIYFFSCLFTVITGGILLSINLKRVNRKDIIWLVLGYSIAYTTISISILSQFERNTVLTLLVSMLGSFALYNYFWKKYIGAETKYQTKPIWIPLIICVAITSFLIWAIIVTKAY